MTAFVTLHNERDTQRFATCVARTLSLGSALGLCGDLGVGKTTLTRFLVDALGGEEGQVASPSFTLQNEYQIDPKSVIEHWDLYRLRELPEELLEPPGPTVIRIVEWPDRVPGYRETLDLVITLAAVDAETRQVAVSGPMAPKLVDICSQVFP